MCFSEKQQQYTPCVKATERIIRRDYSRSAIQEQVLHFAESPEDWRFRSGRDDNPN